MSNRLNLDFSLEFNDERTEFINKYILSPEFQSKPLTDSELSTIADYLLYGRNRDTNLNAVQDKTVQISSKSGIYDSKENVESLDELLASETFNENSISPFNQTHYTTPPTKFSRDAALKLCKSNPEAESRFRDLWRRIDWLDLQLDFYKLLHGKKTNPIRSHLLAKFTEEEQQLAHQNASEWTARTAQKKNELLVELRNEQYTMKDFLAVVPTRHTQSFFSMAPTLDWDENINVLPLGIVTEQTHFIFKEFEQLYPATFTEKQIEQATRLYWEKHDNKNCRLSLDFRDEESVYQMFLAFFELDSVAAEANIESNLRGLLNTLQYYVEFAQLSDIQSEVLKMKMDKIRNQDIADYVNQKYQKNYSANYISTIFKQKIIPQINDAARRHEEIVSNLSFEEEFKTCTCCGRTYLRRTDYFVRKARSKDGLNSRCKKCDRLDRLEKKEINNV